MRTILMSVLFFVVCSVQAQRTSIPLGDEEVTKYQFANVNRVDLSLRKVESGQIVAGTGFVTTNFSTARIKEVVGNFQYFSKDWISNQKFVLDIDAYWPRNGDLHGSRMMFRGKTPFELKKDDDGNVIFPPEAFDFPSDEDVGCIPPRTVPGGATGSFVAVESKAVWVEEGLTFPGMTLDSNFTRNGWSLDCWAAKYAGNGLVYLNGYMISGRKLKEYQAIDGPEVGMFLVLWYDEGRTVGDKWDIGTGKWTPIGYGEVIPPTPPVASADNLKTIYRFFSGTLGIATTGATPGGLYTLESFEALGGPASPVTTLSATDSGELYWYLRVDDLPSKFFSVRVARTGDPAPQKAVARAGFSIP